MDTLEKQLLEKQDQLIRNLKLRYTSWTKEESGIVKELESEIAQLRAQIKEQEGKEGTYWTNQTFRPYD